MKPAFSVIFFTTLAGAGQGLFLALSLSQITSLTQGAALNHDFLGLGGFVSVALLSLGLAASMLHLGHPLRGWRAFTQWRTSWLSREVIALPLFIAVCFFYGLAHLLEINNSLTLLLGLVGVITCFALFICTAMIYACLKFLREWATPLTLVNFILLGCASGFTLASALAAYFDPSQLGLLVPFAVILSLAGLVTRIASLRRNRALRANPKSTLQSAIGIRHPKITQRSMGMMGGSFNTREFFHGQTAAFVRRIRGIFLLLVFPVPIACLLAGYVSDSPETLVAGFALQYLGLLAERWLFFAEVNHPQNLYYQTVG